jgi:hypothetical protein
VLDRCHQSPGRHLDELRAQIDLSRVLRLLGRYAEAGDQSMTAMRSCSGMLGENHPVYWQAVRENSIVLRYLSAIPGAATEARDAHEALTRICGELHPEALAAGVALAGVLLAAHCPDLSELDLARRNANGYASSLGAAHPFTKACGANLELDQAGIPADDRRQDLYFDPPRI